MPKQKVAKIKNKNKSEKLQSFIPIRYSIQWTSANPLYDVTFNLVPSITLYESLTEINLDKKAIAFILFREDGRGRDVNYDEGRNIYTLNYPLSSAGDIIRLIESGKQLTVKYKEEEQKDRKIKWIELYTNSIPI